MSDHARTPARHAELHEKTRQLLQGPLKHARVAALTAALLPLAAVPAITAPDQVCSSGGGVCGFVWNDSNMNGIQETGELGIEGAVVTLLQDGTVTVTATDVNGYYEFFGGPGTYQVAVQIPPGTQPSPTGDGSQSSVDSDGIPNGTGDSVATVFHGEDVTTVRDIDFGFFEAPVASPGTGTPGYWKNHPEAWPVVSITVGGKVYSQAEALSFLDKPGKDKTLTMFSSLVSAKLNLLIGNDPSCVEQTIADADAWMAMYGPAGKMVHASSYAWKVGEPLHRHMDNYNNGMLCAPHRD